MEHYVILHNQVPRYVHRDPCYAAMAKYVALRNATYLAIATVFGPNYWCTLGLAFMTSFSQICRGEVCECVQGGTGIGKKDPGSIFFLRPPSAGLTNYVIRHMSQYSKNIKLRLKWQSPSCHRFVPSRLFLPVRVCCANRAFFGNLVYIPLCLIWII